MESKCFLIIYTPQGEHCIKFEYHPSKMLKGLADRSMQTGFYVYLTLTIQSIVTNIKTLGQSLKEEFILQIVRRIFNYN